MACLPDAKRRTGAAVRGKDAAILDSIRSSKDLPGDTEAKLKTTVESYAKSFQ